jgi:hypothetical protein
VLGLTSAWQYAVYGAAIAAGMVISGERIVGVFGGLLQKRRVKAWIGTSELELDEPDQDRREVLEERPVSL